MLWLDTDAEDGKTFQVQRADELWNSLKGKSTGNLQNSWEKPWYFPDDSVFLAVSYRF